jgi:hypothetical protein|tara:strand:+ start:585 stop:788 length:204 start_codon:yes stop_codon:yes gene_type:complete
MNDDKYMDKSLIERPSNFEYLPVPKLVRTNALGFIVNKLTNEEKKPQYRVLDQNKTHSKNPSIYLND